MIRPQWLAGLAAGLYGAGVAAVLLAPCSVDHDVLETGTMVPSLPEVSTDVSSVPGPARTAPVRIHCLPRTWSGSFRWSDDSVEQALALQVTSVTVRADLSLAAEGVGVNKTTISTETPNGIQIDVPKKTTFRFRMIFASDGRFEMTEFDPSRPEFITEGKHEGVYGRHVDEVWSKWNANAGAYVPSGVEGRPLPGSMKLTADLQSVPSADCGLR